MFRGTTRPGRDIELQVLNYFPEAALFIEKPIATGPENEIQEAFKVSQAIVDSSAQPVPSGKYESIIFRLCFDCMRMFALDTCCAGT